MSRLFFHAFRDFVAIRFVILFICFSLISCFTHALQVVPGSNCTAACTEHFRRTNTTSSDITCYDEDYNTTAVGKAFRDCVTCEFDSSTFDQQTNQTDLGWALYNLRYAASWCMFDYPRSQFQEVSTPCNRTCGSIATALQTNLLTPNESHPYGYCRDPRFTLDAASCASCYSQVPNQRLLANFLDTLQVACQSHPPPTGYLPISPSQVFSLTTPLTVPSPSPTLDANTTTPSPPEEKRSGGLSWNAKVAIAISVPVAVLLILSLLCTLCYVHRKNRRGRSRKHLAKSSSHRSHRSHHPKSKPPPAHLRYNQHHPPHPGHRKTMSADTTTSEKDTHANTFNRPFTFPDSSIHEGVTYPAPLRTRTTPSPHPTFKTHSSAHTTQTAGRPTTSPRARLPSHLTTSPISPPPTSSSLSPPPLNIRPPPPARGLVSWEQRGIHHARTKSLRDSMRKSGESGQTSATERVKVAMQVPKGANISEWKEETRTPTPVTIVEEGPPEHGAGRGLQDEAANKEGPEGVKDDRPGVLRTAEVSDDKWRRGVGSV